jgi:response regulator RpfG family c-di-GMP phosphodiesterase
VSSEITITYTQPTNLLSWGKQLSLQGKRLQQEVSQKIPVLYVNKDKDTAEMILRWLEMNGCEAVSASSGTEALRLLEKQKFDLCIAEYNLLDCTCFELFQQAQAKSEQQTLGHHF